MKQHAHRALGGLRENSPRELVESAFRHVRPRTPFESKHPTLIAFNSYRNYWMNRWRYSAVAHPFGTVRVAPAEVAHMADVSYERGLGRIADGNWDRESNLTPVDRHPTFKGLKQRFEAGWDWEETAYVAHADERIQAGKAAYGVSTVEEFIDKRCAYVEALYTDIKENGYRSEAEIENESAFGTSPHNLDPIVAISRNGEIRFAHSGKHRFAIAQILDIEIPCTVAVRHDGWQSIRDDVYDSDRWNGRDELRAHPDLQDVV